MKPPKYRPVKLELDGKQRLNKVLAAAGYGSRRSVDELIEQGRVEINGETCSRLGTQVDPTTDKISVDGELIRVGKPIYFAVNKPAGVVCTNRDPQGRPRVIDLVPQGARLFSIGRLDRSSTGLILMTNDGTIAQRLTHPKYGVRKTYRVLVAGSIDRDELGTLKKGVYLAEGKAKADDATIKKAHKNSTEIEIVLSEGKNREIRRVLARIGHKVLALQRTSVGPIKLSNLAEGDYRPLSGQEIDMLKKTAVRLSEGKNGLRGEKDGETRDPKAKTKSKRKDETQSADVSATTSSSEPVDISKLDIPDHLADDGRFVTDPTQIPVANWDDDQDDVQDAAQNDAQDEDSELADENFVAAEALTPELEAELDDFFNSSDDSDEADMSEDFDLQELESVLADDDDDDDDFDPMLVAELEAADDDDDNDDDQASGIAADAVLIRDTNSPWKGRVIGDDAGRPPRERKAPRGEHREGPGRPRTGGPGEGRGDRRDDRRERKPFGNKPRGERSEAGPYRGRSDRGGARSERPDGRPNREGAGRYNSGGGRPAGARSDRNRSEGDRPAYGRSDERRSSDNRSDGERGNSPYGKFDRGRSDRNRSEGGRSEDRRSEGRGEGGRGQAPRSGGGSNYSGRRERGSSPYRSDRSDAPIRERSEQGSQDGERSNFNRNDRPRYGGGDRAERRPYGNRGGYGGGRSDRGDRGPERTEQGERRPRPSYGSSNERPSSPYGQRSPRGRNDNRSGGDRPYGGKPAGGKPFGERSSGGKPFGNDRPKRKFDRKPRRGE